MKQREVTDNENVRWTCVQAYAGLEGKVSDEIAEKSGSQEGTVPVVCTPSGGEKSVRIELQKDWEEMPDEELVSKINEGK